MTNTERLRMTSDNEIEEIGPVPSGCGANRAILRYRPRLWNHQSPLGSASHPIDEDLSMGAPASSDPIFARNAARPNSANRPQ